MRRQSTNTTNKRPSGKALPKDFSLAQRAAAARKESAITGNLKDLRRAIKLYTQAAIEARKMNDTRSAEIFASRAHNLVDFLREEES